MTYEKLAGPGTQHLVTVLDPELEVLRGAFPYASRPAELPDDAPVPSLRLSRRREVAGLVVALDRYLGDQRTGSDLLAIDRLPLDERKARPRRRAWPQPPSVACLGTRPHHPGWLPEGVPTLDLAFPSPLGPVDLEQLRQQAAEARLVVLNDVPATAATAVAGLVLQLVAGGTPCLASPRVAGELPLLSPDLRAAIAIDVPAAADDELQLAALAADQRRVAWLDHDLRASWGTGEGTGWRPRLTARRLPSVSVVLVSRRPRLVPTALAMIAEQTGVSAEVIVGLHGGGDTDDVTTALAAHGLGGHAFRVPAEVPFGSALNAAVERSSGTSVAKWDDDDLYGPRHLQDLLIAQRQTGAELVGKATEFVYLDGTGELLWRLPARAESPYLWLAGGTFLALRSTLDQVGGFPDIARAVDHHLKLEIHDAGGTVFRTHGFGFVHRRHSHGHTWDAPASQLRDRAVRTFSGVPKVVGLGDAARFVDLAGRW